MSYVTMLQLSVSRSARQVWAGSLTVVQLRRVERAHYATDASNQSYAEYAAKSKLLTLADL